MSAYLDIDEIAGRLARDRTPVAYYQLTNAIDATFDRAGRHAATDGERSACEAGRRDALDSARRLFRGDGGVTPAGIAEGVRRAVRDSGTRSWHEDADASDQREYERIRGVAGLGV